MCKNFVGVLVAHTGEKRLAAIARCKSWYCEECAKMNTKQWRAAITDYINKNPDKVWCFFTLTAHRNAKTAEYSLKNIQRAWDRLIKRLKRKYGAFEYVRVYEKHQSGRYHLHAIASFHFGDIVRRNRGKKSEYTDSPTLRKIATNLGLGYMTSADDLNIAFRAVSYATKYMTKQMQEDREEWGRVRRIQTSRGIKYKSEKASEYDWVLHSAIFLPDLQQSILDGIPIILLNEDGRELTYDDFLNSNYYPTDGDV